MSRLALFVVGGVLAALAGFWLLRDTGDATQRAEPLPIVTAAAAVDAPSPAPAVANAPTPERSEAAPAAAQPPIAIDAPWFDVQVVDADLQPVPGAEVLWTTMSMFVPPEARQAQSTHPDDIARRFGWRTRSDARGMARVAGDQLGATVHALDQGRYGMVNVGGRQAATPEGWRLVLAADRTLRVLVLDGHDQPAAGIPVAIRLGDPDPARNAQLQGTRNRLVTAHDGTATFVHLQLWHRPEVRPGTEDRTTSHVVVALPGLDAAAVAFDREAPPATPIVLRLPPTGSLLAQLRHEGQPSTADVRFLVVGTDTDPTAHVLARSGLGGGTACDADGWARFPHVPIGRALTVYANSNGNVLERSVPGPTRAGDEVRVEFTTDDVITLVGRLLGPDAQPLANAEVGVGFHVDGAPSGGRAFRTDAQGRFRCPLVPSPQPRAPLKHLLLTHSHPGAITLRASIAPRDVVAGRNDLGDVTLDAGPLVVSGRVVLGPNDRGVHVAIAVQALAANPGPDGEERWEPQPALIVTQQPDGAFEVRGEAKPARHRLVLTGQIVPMPPHEFRVGESGLMLEPSTGSTLTAECSVPTWLAPMQLRGVLRRQGEPAARTEATAPRSTFAVRRGTDGATLRWQQLPAGTYTLELGMLGLQAPLATLAEVVVPQPTPGDPRLTALDVRERVQVRTVRVERDPATPNANSSTLVFVLPQADPEHWTGFAAAGDEVEIVTPPGPVELQVLRAGYRPVQATARDGVTTVRLEAWPSLALTFADLPPLPDGVALHGTLREVDATKGPDYRTATGGGSLASLRATRSFAVQNGRATVAPGDGTFRPVLYLLQNGNRRVLRAVTPEQLVGNAAAAIAVQVSADEIRTALGELAAMPAKK